MPYIRFRDVKKRAEGFFLLATHGDQGSAFPHDLFWVTDRCLKDLDEEFRQRSIEYDQFTVKELNERYGKKKKNKKKK